MCTENQFHNYSRTSNSWNLIAVLMLAMLGLLFLSVLSCAGASKPMGVETVAYAQGVVDMADDAIALLTGDSSKLQKRGLLNPSSTDVKARIEDWKNMRRTAIIMLERNGIDVQLEPMIPVTPVTPSKTETPEDDDYDTEVIR